ncbi:hypothetical protein CTI14_38410 [Methylobacterium radiotolerans]|nr:hypothetical protein CTI14_38410 [Methylobacterium radiotolerans]
MLGVLKEPFVVSGNTVTISASVGVAVSPQDGTELAVLQRRADEAMYRVKRQRPRRRADHVPPREPTPRRARVTSGRSGSRGSWGPAR